MQLRSKTLWIFVAMAIPLIVVAGSCRSIRNESDQYAKNATPPTNDDRGMMGRGMMEQMPEWMMSGGMMDSDMMRDMGPIHDLLMQHEKIQRNVEEIPDGIRAVTTSRDPEIAKLIRTHVGQMKSRIEDGRPIRMMDPLFREIFRHHEKIRLEVEDVPGGVRVTETSSDPQVVLLIRQHAKRAVSEFVSGGMQRSMQPTPLPEGYKP